MIVLPTDIPVDHAPDTLYHPFPQETETPVDDGEKVLPVKVYAANADAVVLL